MLKFIITLQEGNSNILKNTQQIVEAEEYEINCGMIEFYSKDNLVRAFNKDHVVDIKVST